MFVIDSMRSKVDIDNMRSVKVSYVIFFGKSMKTKISCYQMF